MKKNTVNRIDVKEEAEMKREENVVKSEKETSLAKHAAELEVYAGNRYVLSIVNGKTVKKEKAASLKEAIYIIQDWLNGLKRCINE